MNLRAATWRDAITLFEWRNDPRVRANFLHADPIAWVDHLRWLGAVLADDDRLLLIAEEDDIAVGTIRFDTSAGRNEVSVTVAPCHQGRGLGSAIIDAATARCPTPADAYVRLDNGASIAAFRKAGYRERRRTEHDGVPVVHLSTD